nr:phage tail sheath C-terminal domain-containing protein [uncultured Duganella sp.]
MAGVYKTPGVYIVEKSAFPNSVVEVATAVPAFIGYTEKADNKGSSLFDKPWRITSLAEYDAYFGKGPADVFTIADLGEGEQGKPAPAADFTVAGKGYTLKRPNDKDDTFRYYLYRSIQLFFQNGGGACYIVSVGKYQATPEFKPDDFQRGVLLLLKEQEPTMVLVPDAMALDQANSIKVQQSVLAHCGDKMKNRFAILDIHDGYKDFAGGDPVGAFRGSLGINHLDYAAAYYPWLNTSIVDTVDLGFKNLSNLSKLSEVLLAAFTAKGKVPDDLQDFLKQLSALDAAAPAAAEPAAAEGGDTPAAQTAKLSADELHKILFAVSPAYANILATIQRKLNLLPPSGAMAGIYTMVDNARGVWKAPANVSLAGVISPAVNISHDEQEDLNVTTAGKSINAIRSFIGEGVLVWGARTLDGNSLDWRYINVRRTMIMIEESLRLATKAYVFEPNVSGTWVTIKGMANNFLTSVWKRGGLAGASPEDAFSVSVGLGETMTPEDILEGILRVTILVAVSRPAEFIEITFQQQMQKS